MSALSQREKRRAVELREVRNGRPLVGADPQVADYHDRELLEIAAFRLRDAAQRVATLVSMTGSAAVREELVAVCDRLMEEERHFLLRALGGATLSSVRAPERKLAAK